MIRAPALPTHRRFASVAADYLPPWLLIRRGPRRARRIALTFDDGPDPMTGAYLDVLERFDARATFFLIGRACLGRSDDVVDLVRRGHELGNHGFHHRPFPSLGTRDLREELRRTFELLPPPRRTPALVRPPRGTVSARTLLAIALAGHTTVLWSVDSDDCRTRDATDVVASLAPERIRAGDIVLLHEGQRWTLDALPTVLDRLRGAGFELVTVSELVEDNR